MDDVAPEPVKLDGSLLDLLVYMRWETYGWQLGRKIYATRSHNRHTEVGKEVQQLLVPDCVEADGSKGPAKLAVGTTSTMLTDPMPAG